jgi:hypothetical protein
VGEEARIESGSIVSSQLQKKKKKKKGKRCGDLDQGIALEY